MLLTLWRHGEADFATTDEVRALTPRGCEEVVAMARDYVAWAGVSGLGRWEPPSEFRKRGLGI